MSTQIEVKLSFQQRRCDRCGGQRLNTQSCPHCGARPHPAEYQSDLQRRKRIVGEFRARRRSIVASLAEANSLRKSIGATMAAVSDALAKVGGGDADVDDLVDAFALLDATVSAWTQLHLRPGRNVQRVIGESLVLLRDAYELVLDAMTEDTMMGAQSREKAAQAAFDAAKIRLSDLTEYRQYSDSGVEDASALVQLVASSSLDMTQGRSLAEMDSVLRARHTLGLDAPAGAAFELEMFRPLIVLALDQERVELFTARVETVFAGVRLERFVSDSDWTEEHGRVTSLLADTMSTLETIDGLTDLQTLERLLNLVLKLKEAHARHLLATLLDARGYTYASTRGKTTGEVFKLAAREFPELELDDLRRVLRDAAGHSDFNIEGSVVTIRDRGKLHEYSAEVVLDGVLAYLELSIILQVGLHRAVSEQGLALGPSRHMSLSTRRTAIVALLAASGWSDIVISELGENVRISATGSPTRLGIVGMGVMPLLPEAAKYMTIELVGENNSAHRACAIDVQQLRGLELTHGVETALGAVQLMRINVAHRVDGTVPLTAHQLNAFAQLIACDSTESEAARLRWLHELADAAKAAGHAGVLRVIDVHRERLRSPKQDVAVSAFHRPMVKQDLPLGLKWRP